VAVVDNMDNAVILSKMSGTGGLRFVTLDGEVINSSGAITGGKSKNATGHLLERKQEVFRMEEELKEMRKEIAAANERLEELKEITAEMEEVIKDTERDFHQAQLQSSTLNTRIQTLEESGKDLEKGREKSERELAAIENDFAAADLKISQHLKNVDELKEEISRINNTIEENLKAWEEAKADVDHASEAITQTRITKNEWDSKLDSFNQLLARVKDATDDLQNQIDIRTMQQDKLEAEKNRILYGTEGSAGKVEEMEAEKAELESYISVVREERAQLSETISRLSEEQSQAADKLNSFQDQKYQTEIKIAKNDTQLETFKEKLWEEFEISYLQAMEYRKADFAMSTAQKESRDIKNRIRELGDVNVGSIREYDEVNERYTFLTEQRADILKAMDELKKIIHDMDRNIREKFKESFDQIVINFEDIFRQLFGGGHAELRLDDENNPLESGIEIIAQPPGKKLQNINLMSGGEKTMTAIALMFAVLKTKPTPFCILDEVEAALDDANIDRFASYLRKFENIQFAIVTHQKATMEHADVLYGVTMPEQGISKVLSLRLGDSFDI
ncbi:MAG: AAA family ATPase, partial [Firmicutes bacterium]|nr:AAA family ATPase [Bacillota bacterium]